MNSRRIMRTIWLNKGISRIDIARMLGLDKSTVTMIVSKLISKGLVSTLSAGKSGPHGGRRPIGLGINSAYGVVGGLELASEHCEILAVNLDGDVVFSRNVAVSLNASNILNVFGDSVNLLKKETSKLGIPLIGIGVGVPGVVNPYDGIILKSKVLGVTEDMFFKRDVSGLFEIPVFIDNDANCCCWGELAFHRSSSLQDFMFILGEFNRRLDIEPEYRGVGIGIGLVINGRVFYGIDFTAGEFQSVLWKPGNTSQFSLSDTDMRKSASSRKVLLEVVRELAVNISLIVSTLNLRQIFLGGFFDDMYQDETKEIFTREIENNWSYMNQTECDIHFSSHGAKSVAFGAAGMFLERLFSVPEVL